MFFVYAPTIQAAIALVTQFEIAVDRYQWVSDQNQVTWVPKMRAYDYPIVLTYGCTEISPEFHEFVMMRGGVILPLICRHASH